jgi:ligand-binding sensor domain-containing protein/two-component sensor histidine kinase
MRRRQQLRFMPGLGNAAAASSVFRRVVLLMVCVLVLCTVIRAERLPMKLYTTDDGLRSGFIDHVMRDSRGFIWFCTRDGLSRFDGYRFVNYKIGDTSSAQSFSYMFETRKGIFWIAMGSGALYRFDPNAAAPAAKPPFSAAGDDGRLALNAELVSSDFAGMMYEDEAGNLWAGGRSLFRVEEREGRVSFREIDLHLPPGLAATLQIHSVAEGKDRSLWLGTSHGLLRRLPDGRVIHYSLGRQARPDYVRFILADANGNIWVTHPEGLYVLKPESLSAIPAGGGFSVRRITASSPSQGSLLPSQPGQALNLTALKAFAGTAHRISAIYQQENGALWLAVQDRLVLFDGRDFRSFTDTRSPFNHLVGDRDGDLWITTPDGALKFSVRGLTSYGRADGLIHKEIDSILEDRDGVLHTVSPGWYVSRLHDEDRQFQSIRVNIPDSRRLWTSPLGFLDHTGQWWFLTGRGLYRFADVRHAEDLARDRPSALYTNLDGLPGPWVYCMFEDSRGDLWVSVRWTEQNVIGLVRWQRSTGAFHRFTEADGLPPLKSAMSFAEDQAGNLWFGFYEGGLVRYAAGRFTSFTAADGLPQGLISTLHLDRQGRLWLASSSEGIARVDDPGAAHPSFVRYTTFDGLASSNVRSLTEDLAGRIYVGTVRGVDRLTPETGKVRHYGSADGLAGDFVITAYRDRKGSLWFGTVNGVSRLDPRPEVVPQPPSIRIDALRISGVQRQLPYFGASAIAALELTPAENNLQIDYAGMSMAQTGLLRYQYRLQGIDREWSVPTDQRTVHYANLTPGTYSFQVRAVDPSGLTSLQPASVTFRIFPPLWRRWWALTLGDFVLGLAVTLLYRYRVRHLVEVERVRTNIATDLHDDIGSSLSQIAVLSEVVRRQVNGSAAASKSLTTIAMTSRELVDSLADIVWSINPNHDHLSDLSQRMRRFAGDLLEANEIEFSFDAQEIEGPRKLDVDVRRQVFLIFKEALHNIVKHSGCGNVAIQLRIEKNAITLTVADDGTGFDLAQADQGHGLPSMRQRAKTLRADLDIASQRDRGTTMSLRVPLARRTALAGDVGDLPK